jgi:4-hydroxy-tetrahydrodipicolinate synthase
MWTGTYTALVTPFRARQGAGPGHEGELDEDALRQLVARQLHAPVQGLVPCGTTGESPSLSPEEHRRVISIVVAEARGRVPVIAGAGTASTTKTVELAVAAREAGASGILLVMPYYNRPTQRGLVAHVQTVCREVGLPVMLYNIPGRTGVDLSLEALAELTSVPEVVAIKEATGNVVRAQQIVARFGDRFQVFSGDDALTLPMLSVGAVGVVSVTSNVYPREVSEVVQAWLRGDVQAARAHHMALLPVHDAMFIESNPGPVKYALSARDQIAPAMRLPLVWPTPESQRQIREVLGRWESRA